MDFMGVKGIRAKMTVLDSQNGILFFSPAIM
jgi:hypothetical protein